MTAGAVLEIENLNVVANRRSGPVPVLAGVDLTVAPAEIVGIVGESGSGKSTLAGAVTRLLPESMRIAAGSIRLRGTDVLGGPASRLHRIHPGGVAMVFQSPLNALNPLIPVGSQVAEAFR